MQCASLWGLVPVIVGMQRTISLDTQEPQRLTGARLNKNAVRAVNVKGKQYVGLKGQSNLLRRFASVAL